MKMDQTRLDELFSRHESEPKTQCCPDRHATDYDRRGGMSSVFHILWVGPCWRWCQDGAGPSQVREILSHARISQMLKRVKGMRTSRQRSSQQATDRRSPSVRCGGTRTTHNAGDHQVFGEGVGRLQVQYHRHNPTSTAGAPTSPSTPSGFVVARTNLTQQPQWRSLHPGSVPWLSSSRKMAHFRSVATPRTSIGHFTILDVSKDLHIEQDEPSSFLTTFHTPFGRYHWKHMPFGISSRGVSAKNAQND